MAASATSADGVSEKTCANLQSFRFGAVDPSVWKAVYDSDFTEIDLGWAVLGNFVALILGRRRVKPIRD